MTLFKNKYRIESSRLKDWDYSKDGAYFVTICTHDMKNYFGKVIEDKVKLSSIGKIVNEEWSKTRDLRENVILDEYVIMPNHFHGILMILNDDKIIVETSHRDVSTLKSGSLGAVIGQFKSVCTKHIRNLGFQNFKWQSRYYDHIIRDEKELFNIRQYILNNPIKWTFDKYYKESSHSVETTRRVVLKQNKTSHRDVSTRYKTFINKETSHRDVSTIRLTKIESYFTSTIVFVSVNSPLLIE